MTNPGQKMSNLTQFAMSLNLLLSKRNTVALKTSWVSTDLSGTTKYFVGTQTTPYNTCKDKHQRPSPAKMINTAISSGLYWWIPQNCQPYEVLLTAPCFYRQRVLFFLAGYSKLTTISSHPATPSFV